MAIPAKNKYRVPDVCCYPTDAVFQILSRSDPMFEIQQKCDEYAALGVRHIFLIDPYRRAVLSPHAGGFPSVESAISFEAGGSTVPITLAALFEDFPAHRD